MKQFTLGIIKPDAVKQNVIGEIIKMIEESGIKVKALKLTKLTRETASEFYLVHRDRTFFDSLVEFMISGPIVPMVLEGENVIEKYRKLMGATDHTKADKGTIREKFGTAMEKNAVHGSDSPENAEIEIGFFFTKEELIKVL